MKAEWVALIVGLMLPVIGWAVSVEVRISQANKIDGLDRRIEQLEQAMLPVLTEYGVQKRLKETAPPAPSPVPSSRAGLAPSEKIIRADAEKWAKSQLPNVQQRATEK